MNRIFELENLVIKALENTKELVIKKGVDKKLSAKDNILKYDDVFVEMLHHIVKPISDKDVIEIWKDEASNLIEACENVIENPFSNNGREAVEIYLEKVVFEHFAIWGFTNKNKKKENVIVDREA